ncbi:MAG: asparagine synthase (glutamine-hydrolyzing) [Mesorhizobium amorphae]|nr:MAG: asparagine synthase (glutamine-hydrolyzing) [Mesorhizobium amorphae]
MCGISGLIWRDPSRPAPLAEMERMNRAIAHRGPDGSGVHSWGPAALGHRRLSVLDLSDAAHQPMETEDGALALTFNGEIYNYLELRTELEALGARFRSGGDTAVLLEAFRHWGPDCVRRLNGMWAFAVLDKRRNTLFCSRDRFGIKPFYYSADDERFAFCSEIKGLVSALPALRKPDPLAIRRFLPMGLFDDRADTVFAGVGQLLPAHNLSLDLGTGRITIERFWTPEPETYRERWAGIDPVEALRGLLDDAVRLHMRSDVPVGVCLSGGLDSSTLLALAADYTAEPLRTYSGIYEGRDYDEHAYAVAAREHAGAHGTDIRREPDGDLLEDLARITWAQDMPSAGPGLYTQFNVMRRASGDVKVLLDGQGADELFGGYLYYYGLRIDDLAEREGFLASHRLIAQVLRHFGPRGLGPARAPLSARLGRAFLEGGGRLKARFKPHAAGAEAPPFFLDAAEDDEPASDASGQERFPARLHEDLVSRSLPALLHYEDRNSMAFGLESRVPFLDVRLVEFALGLDPAFKIRDGWTKWVLRKAAEPKLPPSVAWRRSKMGYPTPAARWMRKTRDRDALADLLFSQSFRERGIAAPDAVRFFWEQHQAGTVDRSWLLWRYATLELWFRHFIDRLEPVPAATPSPMPAAA